MKFTKALVWLSPLPISAWTNLQTVVREVSENSKMKKDITFLNGATLVSLLFLWEIALQLCVYKSFFH
jgi:hypothetical protein